MIFKKTLFVLLSLLFLKCSTQNSVLSLTGKYVSKKYNFIDKMFMRLNSESNVVNSDLTLNNDSSYIYNTCGNIIKGKWQVKRDSLILFCYENNYRNDSINKIKTLSCGDKPVIYAIEYSSPIELQQTFLIKSEKVVNKLIKIN
jgi:hypothetical protein